ncbi:hypothetical protein CLMAG_45440 [Clostridium magnum DSM 2767]|uniref:Uncharacterized protein n=2 Tax=Clostridium magnum TaxID=33954 RepID=A0A161WT71_9CLOT|nr:hypothetical protein CLMAG_45440 [Clostridium magnum DSM 2767]SHH58934.1 hypothetical protein SAMN02745944_00920 [Clostridium magnum DSM 2767]
MLGEDVMRILGLISKYFLILMVIQGFVLAFIDSKGFKRANQNRAADKAKLIGGVSIIASIVLYVLAIYVA